MGTTLTGLTPATTYDALIKVGDNGPLSATAKYVGDGLGNDSALALSTGNIGIGTNTPDSNLVVNGSASVRVNLRASNVRYGTIYADNGILALSSITAIPLILATDDTERLRITSAGNVGIGTSSPSTRLQVVGGGQTTSIANAATTSTSRFDVANPAVSLGIGYVGTDIPMIQSFNNGTNTATNLTINPFGGNVGIGTSAPAGNLHIASATDTGIRIQAGASSLSYIDLADTASGAPAGSIAYNHIVDAMTFATGGSNTERMRLDSSGNLSITTGNIALSGAGGIYFDSGASKYLDDYEVGTWTMGITFGGVSTGITYTTNTGTYTKIGRQVTVNGLVQLSNKGSSTGGVRITGLPFNVANTNGNYASSSLRFKNISFLNVYQCYAEISTTTVVLEQVTNLGVVTAITDTDFANNSEIIISLTYFV